MYRKIHLIALLLPLLSVAVPNAASAQWRPYPPYPYPAYQNYQPESRLRLNVKPSDAAVYIDGYFAGTVNAFDGKLQRLHVAPGEHEIVVYREGYRSLTERLYLSPNSTRTIDGRLETLGAGAAQDPLPQPPEAGRARRRDDPRMQPPGRESALSIRVQPSAAIVRIDGERWDGPDGRDGRLVVQVSEGRHVVEVERDGYDPFTTEVEVREGETRPLNISLRRGGR